MPSRISIDSTDCDKTLAKLVTRSLFSSEPSMRNALTGVVANADVNVHQLESVGNQIVQTMVEKPGFFFPMSRKDKVITLGHKSSVKVAPERTIDSSLLFQRFMIVSQAGELALEEVMTHELSAFPPALFEENDILRQADKPQLAHAISDFASDAMLDSEPRTDSFVLDGGSLLQRLQRMHGKTYGEIVRKFYNFIFSNTMRK